MIMIKKHYRSITDLPVIMKELKNVNTILVCLVFNLLTATQGLCILLGYHLVSAVHCTT